MALFRTFFLSVLLLIGSFGQAQNPAKVGNNLIKVGNNLISIPTPASAFLPPDVAGLDLWLDSDSGITKDGSDNVSQWIDRTATHTFTQVVVANQPDWIDAQINGHPVIDFNGTTEYLKESIANWLSGSTSGSVFIVAKYAAGTNYFISSADEATATRFFHLNQGDELGVDALRINQRDDDVADRNLGNVDMSLNTPFIATYESSGTSYNLRVDGVDDTPLNVQSGANNGDWTGDTSVRDNIVIGGIERTSVQVFVLKLAELIFYNVELSTADRSLVETYLGNKYNITL